MANEIVNKIAHRQPVRPATNEPQAAYQCIKIKIGTLDIYYGQVDTDDEGVRTYLIIDKNTVAAGQVIPPAGLEHLREWIHDLPYVNDANTSIPDKVVYNPSNEVTADTFTVYDWKDSERAFTARVYVPKQASAPAGAGRQQDHVKREFGTITPDPQPVKVTPQNFTEEQKAQARQNIGAGTALPLPVGYVVSIEGAMTETGLTREAFAEYFGIDPSYVDYFFPTESSSPLITNIHVQSEMYTCICNGYNTGADVSTYYISFGYNSPIEITINWFITVTKSSGGSYSITSGELSLE